MDDGDHRKLRALAVPTRRRLFEILEQAPSPCSVTELTAATGLHPNTVRLHLDVLRQAGLVTTADPAPTPRGRPGVRFVALPADVTTTAEPAETRYRRLALWLAAAVPSPAAAREAGRALGAAAAGEAAGADAGSDPLVALFDLLAAEGFSPEMGEPSGPEAIVLHRCPFADVAAAAPAKVCALHDGLVAGFCAAAGGPDAHVAPAGPGSGRCAVRWT